MLEINTNDEKQIKYLENVQKKIIEEKRIKGYYDDNDIYLVRTTDYINDKKTIVPICDVPFLTQINTLIKSAIITILDEQEHIDMFLEPERYNKRIKEISKIIPLSTQYRSTVHFSLNGLVSSHSKGNFNNKNFIIVDKLNSHLNTDNIISLRAEDTYIDGEVQLSDAATILIRKDRYEDLLKQNPQLKNYEIVLFEGDEKTAVEIYLTTKGVAVEQIGQHGVNLESETGNMLLNYLYNKSRELGIENNPHWLSINYKEDDQKSLILWKYYNELFYNYLLDQINYNEENKKIMVEKLVELDFFIKGDLEFLVDFIKSIGFDKFVNICNEFNNDLIIQVKNGTYKTNRELIEELNNRKNK